MSVDCLVGGYRILLSRFRSAWACSVSRPSASARKGPEINPLFCSIVGLSVEAANISWSFSCPVPYVSTGVERAFVRGEPEGKLTTVQPGSTSSRTTAFAPT